MECINKTNEISTATKMALIVDKLLIFDDILFFGDDFYFFPVII